MSPRNRAERLKTWALEEGFDRAGTALLAASEHGEAFLKWLARGDAAEMGYLRRRVETRIDPRQIMPEARSVLCVALQYHPLQDQEEAVGDLWPGVARYARGRDYHRLMEAGLRRLAARIRDAYPATETRPYVDTGPVLERELAARAGLGAIGKNTNLLHPEDGSWFLLGELFLSLELAPDSRVADLCGSCVACLEACPTGALPEPYRLDSRLCISYWTIEHRGSIPVEVRPLLGQWVFGCDVCQEVCPINADVRARNHPALRLPSERASLNLSALLNLDREGYLELFRASPMKRAKLEGLQRNAAVAMGNSGSTRYVAALSKALSTATPEVQRHAAWALGRIGGATAIAALRVALSRELDRGLRSEIEEALAAVQGEGDRELERPHFRG